MDLGVGEMGFIFCGKHRLLVTRTQVGDPGPMGPRVFLFHLQKHQHNNYTYLGSWVINNFDF